MTGDVGDPMVAEFDTVAEWTAEVAACLGPEYHVPAACRWSGQPAVLDWLLLGSGQLISQVILLVRE